MNTNELKQIQLYRQHITNPTNKITVVKNLCGVQCQILNNAYYAIKIRCNEHLDINNWGDGLIKNWTLRSTVHVFSEDDLPLFRYNDGINDYLCDVWQDEYYGNVLWITGERKKYFAHLIIECIRKGICGRDELKIECYNAGMTQHEEAFLFDGWGGIFSPLCKRGFITYKVQEKKAYQVCPSYIPYEKDVALTEQMKRYLLHIAPATLHDIAYFFKYTQKQVKDILSKLPYKTFMIDNKEYFYLGDINGDYPDIPECVFLSGFDQLMLGYQKSESIYLPSQYLRQIFNLAGIVMPSVLLNGKVAGRWKKIRKNIEITCFHIYTEKEKESIKNYIANLWNEDEITSIVFKCD